MNRPLFGCVLTALLLVFALPVMAEDAPQAETLGDAFNKGTPLLSFLYRYEEVDQEGFDKNAHASTLRTTVGFKSLPYKNTSFLIEAQDVTVLGNAQAYNNKGFEHLHNGVTDRPVVADPAQTTINQAYFQWKNSANKAQLGREEIIIGDARFVGNVGWRQNHQNFDAFTFTNSSVDILDLSYRYLNRVQTVVGSSKDMASHLINADLKLGKIGTLALYGYLLDFTRMENYGGSTSTIGGEFKGKLEMGESLNLLYEVEYAQQSDYADNPNTNLDAQYYFLMAGIALKPVTLKVGYEVLGGDAAVDNNKGRFITPLATGHKFNGWADKFLDTPPTGLQDLHFKANGKFGSLKWLLAYHLFDANDGGAKYGNEFDALLTYKTSWKQTFGAKAAFYSADDFATDTNKFWVWTGYKI
jgi:hypothetical protein